MMQINLYQIIQKIQIQIQEIIKVGNFQACRIIFQKEMRTIVYAFENEGIYYIYIFP